MYGLLGIGELRPVITFSDVIPEDLVIKPIFINLLLMQVTEAHRLGVDLLTVDKSGMTGLHYAVVNNHKEVVNYLIEKGICCYSFTLKDVGGYFILQGTRKL